MFVSDKWKDYELIDASDGERLERWRSLSGGGELFSAVPTRR